MTINVEVQPNVKEAMREVGLVLKRMVPKGVGFALLMFDFGEANTGFMNWISNAQREDMIKALKAMVRKLEGAGC